MSYKPSDSRTLEPSPGEVDVYRAKSPKCRRLQRRGLRPGAKPWLSSRRTHDALTSLISRITRTACATTLNIEDQILQRARRIAARSRLSFRDTINRALRAGRDKLDPQRPQRTYRATTFAMGFPPTPDLDKALQLAARIEDEETIHKLQLTK